MGLFSNFLAFLKALLAAIQRKIKEQRKTSNTGCECSNHRKSFSELKCLYHMQLNNLQTNMASKVAFSSLYFGQPFPSLPEILKEILYVIHICHIKT